MTTEISFYDGDLEVVEVARFVCPICGTEYKTEAEVVKCYTPEIAWQNLFKDLKPGDALKYMDKNGNITNLATIKSLRFGYRGSKCGVRLSVFINEWNNYFHASDINVLRPATEQEVVDFNERQKEKKRKQLEEELAALEST